MIKDLVPWRMAGVGGPALVLESLCVTLLFLAPLFASLLNPPTSRQLDL